MLEIQQQIISGNKTRRSIQPQWLVVHDTGDEGATAQNEHDYFNGGDRGASADVFIDSNNIIQIIDTDEFYSWAIGDGRGKYGKTNSNSMSFEMSIGSDGQPTETTIQNTLDAVKYFMNKYNIDIDHVVTHHECSDKNCPASFNTDGNWTKWNEFKNRLANGSAYKQGWNQNSKGWFYCTDVDNRYYYKDTWKEINSEWYCFDLDGYAKQNNWKLYQNKWYYLDKDCKMSKSKWISWKDEFYYANEKGEMLTNCFTPDNYWVDLDGSWNNRAKGIK